MVSYQAKRHLSMASNYKCQGIRCLYTYIVNWYSLYHNTNILNYILLYLPHITLTYMCTSTLTPHHTNRHTYTLLYLPYNIPTYLNIHFCTYPTPNSPSKYGSSAACHIWRHIRVVVAVKTSFAFIKMMFSINIVIATK